MPETLIAKQKSLEELQHLLQHYREIYPKAKLLSSGCTAAIHQVSKLPNPAFAILL